ncbi:DUF4242 domain-containing protein [Steroidobacter flavus]|uniref:DUF4242 domain-containing protein n=1 Tax=Steroidobacter flavus TaxID=1842136 RepID=A0ABV8T5U9_9GAMM
MTTQMFLERTFDPPISPEQALAGMQGGAWCLEMYRVTWLGSFLALDGASMVCRLTAADAESVRAALDKGGADTRRLWSGTVHEAPMQGTPNVLVERSFPAPVRFEDIQAMELAASCCLEAHRVKFVRTFFAADRKRMLCFYEAPDAEAVRLAQHGAGMPVNAVWAFNSLRVGAPIPRSP